MILQEEFKNNGYINILEGENIQNNIIKVDDLFDLEQKPEELLGIFLSEQEDELFFLLNADLHDINQLCDKWDNLIRGFIILNGDSKAIRKLKYNIVQLIVYSNEDVDKNRETNLMISRKIIIKGNMTDLTRIYIDDFEAIELPFHMIISDSFTVDEPKVKRLKALLPSDDRLSNILEKKTKKVVNRKKDGKQSKSFCAKDFDLIKEWIEA